MTEELKNNKKEKLTYRILLLVLLALLILFGIFFFIKNAENKSLKAEKEQIRIDLQTELDSLLNQHNRVKTEYGFLADSLLTKDSIIQANATEIKQLLNYKWEYYQIKKKLDRLRVVAQGYVYQIDSLYTVNKELKEENVRIRESYQAEREKNIGLKQATEELEDLVTEASVLRAYNIQSTGIRYRGSREDETDKARRTDGLKICFTIGENKLVQPGSKDIYLRIARPDNVILIYDKTDAYTFEYEGNILQYSLKKTIDYNGSAQDVCLSWKKPDLNEDTMEGRYNVSIYADGKLIGESAFELR